MVQGCSLGLDISVTRCADISSWSWTLTSHSVSVKDVSTSRSCQGVR